MKRKLLYFIFTIMSLSLFAQTNKKSNDSSAKQTITSFPYKIFPTQNMWTFIKLDTRNGKMWQVQYGMNSESRFETYLNLIALVSKDQEVNDRFTLYPTQNIYTFILLDQIEGKTWQVQWSSDRENRAILPIE